MNQWYTRFFQTPLGLMQAIADTKELYFLAFTDQKDFEKQKAKVVGQNLVLEMTSHHTILDLLENELRAYFSGKLVQFTVPVCMQGTPFQIQVWHVLQKLLYAHTVSYTQLACLMNKQGAHRAAAHANALNKIAIVIPCHRVILSDGKIGGYAGNTHRKQWLLVHEKTMQNKF